jgi:hypothetical protein
LSQNLSHQPKYNILELKLRNYNYRKYYKLAVEKDRDSVFTAICMETGKPSDNSQCKLCFYEIYLLANEFDKLAVLSNKTKGLSSSQQQISYA